MIWTGLVWPGLRPRLSWPSVPGGHKLNPLQGCETRYYSHSPGRTNPVKGPNPARPPSGVLNQPSMVSRSPSSSHPIGFPPTSGRVSLRPKTSTRQPAVVGVTAPSTIFLSFSYISPGISQPASEKTQSRVGRIQYAPGLIECRCQ